MAHDLPAAYKCSLVFIVECTVVEVGVSLFTGLDWTGLDWTGVTKIITAHAQSRYTSF